MPSTSIYLNFNGNCEEAFDFYKTVFGGEYAYIGRFGEMPEDSGFEVSDADKNKIMHVSLPIGDSVLQGSDTSKDWGPPFVQGNNFSVSVTAKNKDEADKIFNGLAMNGKITMPLSTTFWSPYYGMLTDQFGISWMVGTNDN